MTEKKDGRGSIWPMPDEDWKQVHEHTMKVEEASQADFILQQALYDMDKTLDNLEYRKIAERIFNAGCNVNKAKQMILEGQTEEVIIETLGNSEISKNRVIPSLD